MRFLIRILGNALAIYLAAYFVKNFNFSGDWLMLLLTGLVLAVFNGILKPVLKFISAPLIVLTLGLFSLVINIIILWLLTQFIDDLQITGFWAYFWGTVIISLVNMAIASFIKKPKQKEN